MDPLIGPALGKALVELRDHAHDLAEKLKVLWIDSGETEDRIAADELDPLVSQAAVLAAHADALQHRVTGQSMTTDIGKRIEQSKRERGEWPIV